MNDGTRSTRQSYKVLERLTGWGLALAALVLYLLTLAPTVLEADAGEFQFVPWLPGIAHPTGYPLYTLLGWVWSHLLPVGEVAWRMNLLSAVFAAAAVGVTYAVGRQVSARTLPDTPVLSQVTAAVVAAATFAVGHTFWSQALVAEVYTLHALFVAVILWLALKCGPDLNNRSCQLLALTFGLSLAHHSTTILLLPALGLYLWHSRKIAGESLTTVTTGTLLLLLALLIAPLLLYLYLPLIAPYTPYATLTLSDRQTLTLYENTPVGFWRHVTGQVFSADLRPAAVGGDRLLLGWTLLRHQVGLVGAGLAGVGLLALWQSRQAGLLLLTGLIFLATVLFNTAYFIGDVFVLYIPAWLIISIWIGPGSLGLARWLAKSYVQQKSSPDSTVIFKKMGNHLSRRVYRLITFGLGLLFILLPIVLLTTRIDLVRQNNNVSARSRWQQILSEPIPPAAVLLSNDRNEIMPMWYYQYVTGQRPDLLGLFPRIVPEPAYANVGRVLDQALRSGRPVFLTKSMPGLSLKANLAPVGSLVQATPPTLSPSHSTQATLAPPDAASIGSIRLLGYDVSESRVSPGAVITTTLYWQPQNKPPADYTSYVHLVDTAGQGVTQSDHQPGGVYYPSSLWQPDETLRDRHILTIPGHLAPGSYQLRAGLYYRPELGVIVNLGEPVELGPLIITGPADAGGLTAPGSIRQTRSAICALRIRIWYNSVLLS